MRPLCLIVLLGLAGCSVDGDATNEQVTLQYNKQQIRDTAVEAGRTARNVAAGAANVAAATGGAIRNEVGDIDVNVDVKRTPTQQEGK